MLACDILQKLQHGLFYKPKNFTEGLNVIKSTNARYTKLKNCEKKSRKLLLYNRLVNILNRKNYKSALFVLVESHYDAITHLKLEPSDETILIFDLDGKFICKIPPGTTMYKFDVPLPPTTKFPFNNIKPMGILLHAQDKYAMHKFWRYQYSLAKPFLFKSFCSEFIN